MDTGKLGFKPQPHHDGAALSKKVRGRYFSEPPCKDSMHVASLDRQGRSSLTLSWASGVSSADEDSSVSAWRTAGNLNEGQACRMAGPRDMLMAPGLGWALEVGNEGHLSQ